MKPRMPGPDVVDLLHRQHTEIRRGFVKALLPGPGRQARFDKLRTQLALHEAAEEAHVHPIARKGAGATARVVKERLAEERSAKILLHDLQSAPARGVLFTAKLLRLGTAVLTHAAREERHEFRVIRAQVTAPRRKMLGIETLVTQFLAPTRAHLRVNGQIANKVVSPVLGPLDRGRDLITTGLRKRH